MLSTSEIESKKAMIDIQLRELEDDIACIASIVDSLRKELASVKTEDDAKRFDKRANEANEAFEKLKALQLK